MPLSHFHPIIARWFRKRFVDPTDVQRASWPTILSGSHTLIAAPTGSGKTLAAFLACIDSLFKQSLHGELEDKTQVLYVSPLKALSNDVQINLRQPLAEISTLALEAGHLSPEIRVEVRTGDTPAKNRRQLILQPPHILITTPESLFLLLTAQKSRSILQTVRTIIIDEIHAVAPNKRGAHLALSLERLESLTIVPPNRIGLSATQHPIEEVARFLVGQDHLNHRMNTLSSSASPCSIVNMGQKRTMDLAVEVPKDELSGVATNAIWADMYDRLTELIQTHRSTLVFVNTRRLAERLAHHLAERLGEDQVAAHHGSLSRKLRLSAETRLKNAQTRVVVATASLELGIDIGDVDLVCQIGSPRAIATALQRTGRAGHWVEAIPKGRFFCSTRDELLECAAIIRAMQEGRLDSISVPSLPIDILAQQIVAAVATQEWSEDELYSLCTRAYPYRQLTRQQFQSVIHMLAEGFVPGKGRNRAMVFHDRINRRLRARRGARLAALTSGGAIPDTGTYSVIAEPQETVVGSVDEDFAVESLAGDIMLLGNTSWRIRRVETGVVRVEDAHGAPPNIPFWRGEAPSRTAELSSEVGNLRDEIIARANAIQNQSSEHSAFSQPSPTLPILEWLHSTCGLDSRGAQQAIDYMTSGCSMLGAVPTQSTIIAERFFDDAGGMQLVIHSPFGGRVNKAWGFALRKRFCVNFDFELQAAATDEGLVLSLGEKHSFPLETIFQMLRPQNVRDILTQAVLAAPMFTARWRWNASRALALLRFQNGKRVPFHIQRMRAEDLLAGAFPMATACQDNHVGDIPIPDHPLVQETLKDCLEEAMDIDGLTALLEKIEAGGIRCLTVESPTPSPFSHEILNANPYAFLDDAPLEERRARAVTMRHALPTEELQSLGTLDPATIVAVTSEAWPIVRDADELEDALHRLVWVPEELAREWEDFVPFLVETKRAIKVTVESQKDTQLILQGWTTPDHFPLVKIAFTQNEGHVVINPSESSFPQPPPFDANKAMVSIVRGWMECLGPVTEEELVQKFHFSPFVIQTALRQLESMGEVIRGHFRPHSPTRAASSPQENDGEILSQSPAVEMRQQEWCHRHLLARIHRRTVKVLRQEIEPVSAADFMRFLLLWQHVCPTARLHEDTGLLEILNQLTGFEAAASAWESFILNMRLHHYKPDHLDYLCLRGRISWGRLTPPEAENKGQFPKARARIIPTSLSPISWFPREDADWLFLVSRKSKLLSPTLLHNTVSPVAQNIHTFLQNHGASFFTDIIGGTGHLQAEVEQGLWELTSAGLITGDGFDNLRALLDPHRRRGVGRHQNKRPRHSIGRWALLSGNSPATRSAPTPQHNSADKLARLFLRRYGVVFRDLLRRETLPFAWRDLLMEYRQMEFRGEIRGGCFVSGFRGEQFGLPEAIETLRAVRRNPQTGSEEIRLSGSDPLNLVGILQPGDRIPSIPSNSVLVRGGVFIQEDVSTIATA